MGETAAQGYRFQFEFDRVLAEMRKATIATPETFLLLGLNMLIVLFGRQRHFRRSKLNQVGLRQGCYGVNSAAEIKLPSLVVLSTTTA